MHEQAKIPAPAIPGAGATPSGATDERSAARADSVDRLVITDGVEVPYDLAFLRGIRAEMAVQGAHSAPLFPLIKVSVQMRAGPVFSRLKRYLRRVTWK